MKKLNKIFTHVSIFLLSILIALAIFVGLFLVLPSAYASYIAFFLTTAFVIISLFVLRKRTYVTTFFIASTLSLIAVAYCAHWFVTPDAFNRRTTAKVWNLKTGSQLGYWEYKPNAATPMKTTTPIIFLHGGPSGTLRKFEDAFLEKIAQKGYAVYAFDQHGAGSSYIHGMDISSITEERMIRDLKEIQTEVLKAPQIILIGQSNGGTISIRYASEYPESVESLILTEPGNFDWVDPVEDGPAGKPNAGEKYEQTYPAATDIAENARLYAAIYTQGEKTLGSLESTLKMGSATNVKNIIANSFCEADYANIPDHISSDFPSNYLSLNFLGLMGYSIHAEQKHYDATQNIKQFKGKTMLAIAACSYLPRAMTAEIMEKIPGTLNKYYPNVGHIIWGKNDSVADKLVGDIDAFISAQPLNSDFSNINELKELDKQ